jgi:hypothetical protein
MPVTRWYVSRKSLKAFAKHILSLAERDVSGGVGEGLSGGNFTDFFGLESGGGGTLGHIGGDFWGKL